MMMTITINIIIFYHLDGMCYSLDSSEGARTNQLSGFHVVIKKSNVVLLLILLKIIIMTVFNQASPNLFNTYL